MNAEADRAGRVAGRTFLAALAAAFLAAPYQFLLDVLPSAWLIPLATLGYGGLLFGLAGWAVKARRAARIGVAIALAGWAASFLVGAVRLHADLSSAATSAAVGRFFEARWNVGFERESARDLGLAGVWVLVVWALEGFVLPRAGVRGARHAGDTGVPRCRRCGRRASHGEERLVVDVDPRAVREAAARGDLDEILSIPRDPALARTATFRVRSCPDHVDECWLEVISPSPELGKGGDAYRPGWGTYGAGARTAGALGWLFLRAFVSRHDDPRRFLLRALPISRDRADALLHPHRARARRA